MTVETDPNDNDPQDPNATDPNDDGTGAGTDPNADDTGSDDGNDVDPETEFLAGLTDEQAAFFAEFQTKLTKANGNARKHRLAAESLRQGKGAPPKPKPPAQPGQGQGGGQQGGTGGGLPAGFDLEAFKADIIAGVTAATSQKNAAGQAEQALIKAGLIVPDDETSRTMVLGRAIKLLDLSGVADADDLAVEIDTLKSAMPTLFGRPQRRKPAGGAAGGAPRVGGKGPRKAGEAPADIEALFGQ